MTRRIPGWLQKILGQGGAEFADPEIARIAGGGGIEAAGLSDIGKERDANEDSYLCDVERRLFVVADGMGGRAAGDEASKAVIAALGGILTSEKIAEAMGGSDGSAVELLRESFRKANEAVLAKAEEHPEWKGMASTVVVALLDGGVLHIANLGDSRAYLVRDGRARLLTKDHSVAAVLYEQGQFTEEEARTHPLRNQLTASLGLPDPEDPAYASVELRSGDRVILCSDGLWDMLSDMEIARLVCSYPDPETAASALIDAANDSGGLDNITAVVAFIQSSSPVADVETAAEALTA